MESSQPGCWRSGRSLASSWHTEFAFTLREFLLAEAFVSQGIKESVLII